LLFQFNHVLTCSFFKFNHSILHMCTCVKKRKCSRECVFARTRVRVCVFVRANVCMCACVCVYVCVCVCPRDHYLNSINQSFMISVVRICVSALIGGMHVHALVFTLCELCEHLCFHFCVLIMYISACSHCVHICVYLSVAVCTRVRTFVRVYVYKCAHVYM